MRQMRQGQRSVLEPLEGRMYLAGVAYSQVVWHATTTAPAPITQSGLVSGNLAIFENGMIYDSSTGAWSQNPSLKRRWETTDVLVDGKAIFGSGLSVGRTSAYGVNEVDIYDVATGTWSQGVFSPSREGMAAVGVGHYALFAGGGEQPGLDGPITYSAAVDVYDAQTGGWSTAMLSKPGEVVAAVVGEKALFYDAGTVDIFDSATGSWSSVELHRYSIKPAVTVVGDQAMFEGGRTSHDGVSNVVNIFDGTTGTWTVQHMAHPRIDLTAITAGGDAIFAGGLAEKAGDVWEASDWVDLYHGATGTWSTLELSEPRVSPAVAADGDLLYVAGNNPATRDVDLFNLDHGIHTVTQLAAARTLPRALTVNGKVFFGGDAPYLAKQQTLADLFRATSLQTQVTRGARGHLRLTITNQSGPAIPAGYAGQVFSVGADGRHDLLLGSAALSSPLAAGQTLELDVPLSVRGRMVAGRMQLCFQLVPMGRGRGTLLATERDGLG